MVKKLKVYVFDMGKVIIKPSRMNDFYRLAEMECDYSALKTAFYDSSESDAVYKGIISDDEFFDFIRRVSGSKKSVAELKRLYIMTKGEAYSNVISLITELREKGNTVNLLSNLKRIDHDYLGTAVDLSLFDKLFLSYQLGMSKPHTDIFEHVIDTIGTNDFYFFDDSEKNVLTAKKLGINAYQTTGEDVVKCFSKLR